MGSDKLRVENKELAKMVEELMAMVEKGKK